MAVREFLNRQQVGPGKIDFPALTRGGNRLDVAINATINGWESNPDLHVELRLERSKDNGATWETFGGFTAVGGPIPLDEDGVKKLPGVNGVFIADDVTHVRGFLVLNRTHGVGVDSEAYNVTGILRGSGFQTQGGALPLG